MIKKKMKFIGTKRTLLQEQLENRQLFAVDIDAKWFATVPNTAPAVVADTVISSGIESRSNGYVVQLDAAKVDSVFAAASVLQSFGVNVEKGLGKPGDPIQVWSLQKINASTAWAKSVGSNVVVGVIDTGIDFNHPDLVNQVWRNPGEIPGNGLDDDSNGFNDDVFGVDFANGDSVPFDDNGHGTHVSGTVASQANNQVGVAGVAYGSKIISAKFLNASGSGLNSAGIVFSQLMFCSLLPFSVQSRRRIFG